MEVLKRDKQGKKNSKQETYRERMDADFFNYAMDETQDSDRIYNDIVRQIDHIDRLYIDKIKNLADEGRDEKQLDLSKLSTMNRFYLQYMSLAVIEPLTQGVNGQSICRSLAMYQTMKWFDPTYKEFDKQTRQRFGTHVLNSLSHRELQKHGEPGRWTKMKNNYFESIHGREKFTSKSAAIAQFAMAERASMKLHQGGIDFSDFMHLSNELSDSDFSKVAQSQFYSYCSQAGMKDEQIKDTLLKLYDEGISDPKKPIFDKDFSKEKIYKSVFDGLEKNGVRTIDKQAILDEYNESVNSIYELAMKDGRSPDKINQNFRDIVEHMAEKHPSVLTYFKEYEENTMESKINAGKSGEAKIDPFTLRTPKDDFYYYETMTNTLYDSYNDSVDKYNEYASSYPKKSKEVFYESVNDVYATSFKIISELNENYFDGPELKSEFLKDAEESELYKNLRRQVHCMAEDVGPEKARSTFFNSFAQMNQFYAKEYPSIYYQLSQQYAKDFVKAYGVESEGKLRDDPAYAQFMKNMQFSKADPDKVDKSRYASYERREMGSVDIEMDR